MIKTVKQASRFNPIIRDYRMSQGIENLAELIQDEGKGREFFSRKSSEPAVRTAAEVLGARLTHLRFGE